MAAAASRNFWERLLWPEDPSDSSAGFTRDQDFVDAITAIKDNVDEASFKWRVFWVAGLGFLTDSYNLFASNVILPAFAFVYWDTPSHAFESGFNIATLAGSAIGQVGFGLAVDIYGRRSLYGIELLIVIISTIGLLQCSQGYYDVATGANTWQITPWLYFWRIIMGIGIGAEYPLSACIAAEWSSTKSRARMMGAVFLMQPIGQLLAYIVGLIALNFLNDSKGDIDKLWRIVIGVGAAPTLLALFFRRNIPESWRYTYYVRKNPGKAKNDTTEVYGEKAAAPLPPPQPGHEMQPLQVAGQAAHTAPPAQQAGTAPQAPSRPQVMNAPSRPGSQFRLSELRRYLRHDWPRLAGTSACWFLLDFAFYGMGFNSPGTLAKLWTAQDLTFDKNAPWWQANSDVDNTAVAGITISGGTYANGTVADATIRQVLGNNMRHAIYTTSIASIIGSLVFVGTVHLLCRRKMLIGTFFGLAVLLAIASGSFKWLFHDGNDSGHPASGGHVGLLLLWAVTSFLYSFGPNTLTFIIPAEVFPTRYRCTFYGIAAASGKIGAMLVQIVIMKIPSGPNYYQSLVWLLASFAICMAIGGTIALSSSAIPYVQHGLENLSLEDLSDDRNFLHREKSDSES